MNISQKITIGFLEDNSLKCAVLENSLSGLLSDDVLERFESLSQLQLRMASNSKPFDLFISDLNLSDSSSVSTARFLEKEPSRLAKLILLNSSDLEVTQILVNTDPVQFASLGALEAKMGLETALSRQIEAARLLVSNTV